MPVRIIKSQDRLTEYGAVITESDSLSHYKSELERLTDVEALALYLSPALTVRDISPLLDSYLDSHECEIHLIVQRDTYPSNPYLDSFLAEIINRELTVSCTQVSSCPPPKRKKASFFGGMKASRRALDEASSDASSLDDMIENMDMGFAETLFYFIDSKGISDVECYKRSNVDKKTFSKIKCQKDYRPSKTTAVSFAIGLRLSVEEAKRLLDSAGYSLSGSILFDVIIAYFLKTGEYQSIHDVNEALFHYDQSLLGV